ncbi:hypothetical protein AZF00_08840 [Zhongshania aliphaticivorans]|uniref:Uncharacterized protein n=1 Tax=Zhongshania aliphaticivorans TaxID=1470434 RepID=A0A127M595_9GAMM|nr:hypothetical protein AZF00_08840 [Zhongshania aliphaticivorans]
MSNYAAPIAFVKSIVNARNVNPVSIHKVNFIISIFLALIYNASLWTRLSQEVGELSVSSLAVYLGFFALLTRRSKVSDIMREWTKKLMQENYP